ncbi:UNVERIFIED_CONTAM: hypothetical protein Sradi_6927800 [Sesamum radiatum]|uniref:Uncharacterized protein n=1 Tax=Sesamum radiatum TaxID=300843 RepID=A0AAW2JGA9_SESRA
MGAELQDEQEPSSQVGDWRPSTPFRPRASLLPRRCVRTGADSLPDLVTCPVPRSGVESHGCSSSSQSGLPFSYSRKGGPRPSDSTFPMSGSIACESLRIGVPG